MSTISDNEYPDKEYLLKAADEALYQGKNDQRNCVHIAEEHLPAK
ncbi:hypothetical protein KKE54_06795 [bacterium]|nr:hypothetical protein [bacterium]